MAGKNIAILLHMYQPPWQYEYVLERVSKECYEWLTDWLSKNNLRVTLNINYSLTELLIKNNLEKIIENIGDGVESNTIELTGSSAYHAILPLLPETEARRQIKLNHDKNRKVFGSLWDPKGFFPPEMAFSPQVAGIIKDIGLGYKWAITEDIVYSTDRNIPDNFVAAVSGLPIIFRSSYWSNKFAIENPHKGETNAEKFVNQLSGRMADNSYVVLAFDMEAIGHHHRKNPYNEDTMHYLEKTIRDSGMNCVFISELLEKFPAGKNLKRDGGHTGSWSTTKQDISDRNYFPLWKNPRNPIHKIQWELIGHAINVISKSGGNRNYRIAMDLLDRGLNSCQFWWAAPENMRRTDYHPGCILDGSKLVRDSVTALPEDYESDKIKISQLYQKLEQEVRSS